MTSLLGKKIFIIGGNGYIGNFIAAKMIQNQATVYCLTRRGNNKYEYQENEKINWLKGDVTNLQANIKQKMNEADVIVHSAVTVGQVITKKQNPKYNSFISMLDNLQNKKKVIYVSTETLPKEFDVKYFKLKRQSQRYLFKSEHEGYILRPGMVYNFQKRKWNLPIVVILKVWAPIYNTLLKLFNILGFTDQSSLIFFFKYLKGNQVTSLQNIGKVAVHIAKSQKPLIQKTYEPKQIEKL